MTFKDLFKKEKRPFTTDGCSGGMSAVRKFLCKIRIFKTDKVPWHDACVKHDKAYWDGGTAYERLSADGILYFAVHELGYKKWAFFMLLAIRLGGMPCWPLPWRWNYGYRYPHKIWYNKAEEINHV